MPVILPEVFRDSLAPTTGVRRRGFRHAIALAAGLIILIFAVPSACSESVRVGVVEKSPLVFLETSGQYQGIFPELLRLIAQANGWELEYVTGSRESIIQGLDTGAIDVFLPAEYAPDLTYPYDFSETPVFVNWNCVCVPPDSPIKTVPDLERKHVAVMKDDAFLTGPRGLRRTLQDYGVVCKVVEVDDTGAVFRKIHQNETDAGVVDRFSKDPFAAQEKTLAVPIVFGPLQYRFAFPRKNAKAARLQATIDAYLRNDALLESSHWRKILAHYLPEGSEQPSGESGSELLFAPEERAWLTAHPVITITSDSKTPPYFFKDSQGNHTGIICDLLDRIGRILGVTFAYTGENYAELIKAVQEGAADVTVLNDPQDAPYEQYYLKTRDVLFLPYSLWVRDDSSLLTEKQPSFEGRTLVLTAGWDLGHPFLKQFQGAKLVPLAEVRDCAAAVLNGQADGYIDVYSIIADLVQRNLFNNLRVLEIYNEGCPAAFFVRKDWPELHSALAKALDTISEDELLQILIRWKAYLDNPSFRLKAVDFNEEEREWVRQKPMLRAGFDPKWAPIEFADESGGLQGVSAEYLNRLTELIGVQFVVTRAADWQETYARLRSGEIDMVPTLGKTPERSAFLDFTAPYLSLPISIFAMDNLPYVGSLEYWKNKRIGVVKNYIEEVYLSRDYPDIEKVLFSTVPEALHAVDTGAIDAYMGNIAVANHYISKNRLTHIRVAGETEYRYELSMAVRKEDAPAVSVLNKALTALPQSEKDAIYQKWVPVRYAPEFDYSLLWKLLAAALALFALFIFWNRRLAALVRVRTAALNASNQDLQSEVEERRRAENALRQSEERFRALFDISPYACALQDKDGRYLLVNQAFIKDSGCDKEAIYGKDILGLGLWLPPEQQYRLKTELVDKGYIDNAEIELLRTDGRIQHVLTSSRKINLDGEPQVLSVTVDITDRKRAEQALQASEKKYRSLFEAASDAIFLLHNNVFVDCNAQALRMFGCSREQLFGLPPSRFSPPCQADGSDSFERAQAEMMRALGGGTRFFEWRHCRFDGTPFDAEVNLNALDIDGEAHLLAIVRDVSARKQSEQALKVSEQNYREIFNATNEAIFIHDAATGAFLDMNQTALDMFGYSEEEIRSRTFGDLSSGQPGYTQAEAMEKMLQADYEGSQLFEWECRHKEGHVFLTEVAFKKTRIGGQGRVLSVMRDITDRKNLEGQFRQAQKMEAVGQLAGGVAHDFNNLLQVINGYAEMALDESENGSPIQQDLNEVLGAGKRASRLVSQLLTFSRRQVIRPEYLSLRNVIEDLLKMLKRVIGEHIQLEFHPEPHTGLVHADRGQLEQILMNLCVNARDAMPEGGSITITLKGVQLNDSYTQTHAYVAPGNYVELSVADTGCGMDGETQKHIFEPFFTTKEMGRGTGLGLATVYGIVKQHDGYVQVYSELGLGTCFKIYLPLVRQIEESAAAQAHAPVTGGHETILLAEDDDAIRQMTQKILENAGYSVLPACDGREALQVFRENSARVHLVLLDVVMPKLGGRVVYEDIKKQYPRLPFLFTSGYNPDGVHTGFILDEGIELLPKPFAPSELLRRLRALLDATQARDH